MTWVFCSQSFYFSVLELGDNKGNLIHLGHFLVISLKDVKKQSKWKPYSTHNDQVTTFRDVPCDEKMLKGKRCLIFQ